MTVALSMFPSLLPTACGIDRRRKGINIGVIIAATAKFSVGVDKSEDEKFRARRSSVVLHSDPIYRTRRIQRVEIGASVNFPVFV